MAKKTDRLILKDLDGFLNSKLQISLASRQLGRHLNPFVGSDAEEKVNGKRKMERDKIAIF